jgi:hypothetical protein
MVSNTLLPHNYKYILYHVELLTCRAHLHQLCRRGRAKRDGIVHIRRRANNQAREKRREGQPNYKCNIIDDNAVAVDALPQHNGPYE